jgi:FixJ family two-component response regulator
LTRDALSLVFTLAGYRVLTFADAMAFLAAARGHAPGCGLLDLHLPVRSIIWSSHSTRAPLSCV